MLGVSNPKILMKKFSVLLIIAMTFSITLIGFSKRGPVNGKWYNRDKDVEKRWTDRETADPEIPDFYITITREGEDSDGPAFSESYASADQHLLYAWTYIGARGSAPHDVWEWRGSAFLAHDWVTTTPGPNPHADSGAIKGDFTKEFNVYLREFGHLPPEGTISDCQSDGWVASDIAKISPEERHSTLSRTDDNHRDIYINGKKQQPEDNP